MTASLHSSLGDSARLFKKNLKTNQKTENKSLAEHPTEFTKTTHATTVQGNTYPFQIKTKISNQQKLTSNYKKKKLKKNLKIS